MQVLCRLQTSASQGAVTRHQSQTPAGTVGGMNDDGVPLYRPSAHLQHWNVRVKLVVSFVR